MIELENLKMNFAEQRKFMKDIKEAKERLTSQGNDNENNFTHIQK